MWSPFILEAQKHFNHDLFVTNCIRVVFTTHTLTHELCCFGGVYAKLYKLAYVQQYLPIIQLLKSTIIIAHSLLSHK